MPDKFSLDGKEFDTSKLTELQFELLRQCQDLTEQRRKLEFQLRQATGALDYFIGQLRVALIDTPKST